MIHTCTHARTRTHAHTHTHTHTHTQTSFPLLPQIPNPVAHAHTLTAQGHTQQVPVDECKLYTPAKVKLRRHETVARLAGSIVSRLLAAERSVSDCSSDMRGCRKRRMLLSADAAR